MRKLNQEKKKTIDESLLCGYRTLEKRCSPLKQLYKN